MFGGIYPILYAFFRADGVLDLAAMRRQVAACVAHPCHGIAALGLATEVNKLAPAEKRAIVALLAEENGRRKPLTIMEMWLICGDMRNPSYFIWSW